MRRGAPRGIRFHIGLFGRRNVGKSSLLNAIARQQVSIVSSEAGTTTDPVEKPMELLPLGPVVFIDTAGVDDDGGLGELRVAGTRRVLDRTDLGVVVAEADRWNGYEDDLLAELRARSIPVIVVFNKSDRVRPTPALTESLAESGVEIVRTAAVTGAGIPELRRALLDAAPDELINRPGILGDMIGAGDLVVMVTPIDKEAPKGRLILPQNQTIRDVLDHEAQCLAVQDTGLAAALSRLDPTADLVITDSQVFESVARDTPPSIPMTSFSILFADWKADLAELVRGARVLDRLQAGDRVLVAEACSHHPIEDDIGRVRIPRWLNDRVGGGLRFTHVQGHDFPEDLASCRLVVHCGACMFNRREMLTRLLECRRAGVPMTNYGLTIAWAHDLLDRALVPFPAARRVWREATECV